MPGTVNLVDRTTGQTFGVPQEQVASYLAQGFHPESDEEGAERTAAETFHAEHGGVEGAIGATLAGGLSGLTLGLSDQALGALGADRVVRHMEAEHPYATGIGTVGGALLPTALTGGAAAGEEAAGIGARILAASPAGLVGRGGRAIAELGESGGLVGRLAAGTAGAAAEGAAYGGGQYLTETALEDKPLSAAGFVAGMGHGALFAAPIGAAGTLASATLQRARSLFPRSEVSAAAAAGVKGEATSALGQAVRDGDAMAQAAERKLSDIEAGAQTAQAGETVTRRVFGQAHPQAIADQVTGAVDRQQVAQALEGYQQARQGLEDWIADEADPDLERALQGNPAFRDAFGKLDAGRPALDKMLASAGSDDLETMLGQVGGRASDPDLDRAMRATLELPDMTGPGGVPMGEFGAPGAGGFKGQNELSQLASGTGRDEGERVASLASADATSARTRVVGSQVTPADLSIVKPTQDLTAPFDIAKTPLRFDPERRQYFNMDVPAEPMGGVPAQEIVQRGMAGEKGAVGKLEPTESPANKVPEYSAIKAHETRADAALEQTLPAREIAARGYHEPPIRSESPGMALEDADPVRMANARKAIAEGQREPIDLTVSPSGKIGVTGGRHRLQAAIEADAPIKVKWSTGTEPIESDVLRHGAPPARSLGEVAAEQAPVTPEVPKKNLQRVEAAKKAGAVGAERRREIHSAVASNLPQELQSTWDKEGYRFMQEEGARIVDEKDPINAASNISEAFAEKYGSASETGRGYEGDRYHRRAEIEAKHGESWAREQERKYYAEAKRPHAELALIAKQSDRSLEDLTELFEERAAIHEFEGGEPRVDAERLALDEVANAVRGTGKQAATDTLTGQLRGMQGKLGAGEDLVAMGAPARDAYRAAKAERTSEAAAHFRGKAIAAREARAGAVAAGETPNPFHEPTAAATGGSEMDQFFRDLNAPKTRDAYVAANIGRAMREEGSHAAALAKVEREWAAGGGAALPAARTAPVAAGEDPLAQFGLESDPAHQGMPTGEVPAEVRAMAMPDTTAIDAGLKARMGGVRDEAAIAKAIMRHNGKGADMGPGLARAAKAIGAVEEANAKLVDILGPEAPPQAAAQAKAYRATVASANDRAAASTARTAQDLATKAQPAADATVVDSDIAKALRRHESATEGAKDRALVSMRRAETKAAAPALEQSAAGGVGGRLADVGSALEVLRAIGAHVPVLSHIPIIGPVLGLWLKARAVLGILGRKGGSIGKSTEGLIASKAAATRDRIATATGALLEGGARAAGRAAHMAGPAVLLAGALFPGGDKPASDKPRDLFEARTDDIVRAQQPGAIDQAIAQRYPTSDPAMHDAIVAQVQRGIAFLDAKRPKETVLPGILPGDGTWKPSAASIDEFGKFVHAVNDPVSVLEDLAKGHPSAEGAETLRAVYPELYQLAQKELLQAAPVMAKVLPYPRRVMLSILYQIPIDGTMQPSHAQFLQAPAPAPAAHAAPASAGPFTIGQQTLSPLDRRASGA